MPEFAERSGSIFGLPIFGSIMPGHSRSKNGVASLAYVPGIHVLFMATESKTWMAGTSPAMTERGLVTLSIDNRRSHQVTSPHRISLT